MPKKLIFPVITIILLLLILFKENTCNCQYCRTLKTVESEKKPIVDENRADYFEVPVVTPIIVSEKNPFFQFSNPKENTVYMGYTVYYQDEVVFDSDGVVEPSKFVNWNVYDTFKQKGNYDISIAIATYDITTQAPCSSAMVSSEVTIR